MPNWLDTNLPKATNVTAFLAGMWSAAVLLSYSLIEPSIGNIEHQNYAFLVAGLIGLVPAFPFVFGDQPKREGSWKERTENQLRFIVTVMRRSLFWLLGAATLGFPVSLFINLIANVE